LEAKEIKKSNLALISSGALSGQAFENLTRQGVPMADYIFPFEKLDVWQLAVDLAEFVLGLLEQIPRNKHIRLISQMEAATTSPAQNIGGSGPASSLEGFQAGG
jgi:hypothetical protein